MGTAGKCDRQLCGSRGHKPTAVTLRGAPISTRPEKARTLMQPLACLPHIISRCKAAQCVEPTPGLPLNWQTPQDSQRHRLKPANLECTWKIMALQSSCNSRPGGRKHQEPLAPSGPPGTGKTLKLLLLTHTRSGKPCSGNSGEHLK